MVWRRRDSRWVFGHPDRTPGAGARTQRLFACAGAVVRTPVRVRASRPRRAFGSHRVGAVRAPNVPRWTPTPGTGPPRFAVSTESGPGQDVLSAGGKHLGRVQGPHDGSTTRGELSSLRWRGASFGGDPRVQSHVPRNGCAHLVWPHCDQRDGPIQVGRPWPLCTLWEISARGSSQFWWGRPNNAPSPRRSVGPAPKVHPLIGPTPTSSPGDGGARG